MSFMKKTADYLKSKLPGADPIPLSEDKPMESSFEASAPMLNPENCQRWNGEIFFKFELVVPAGEKFKIKDYMRRLQVIKEAQKMPYQQQPLIMFFYLYGASTVSYKQEQQGNRSVLVSIASIDCSFYTDVAMSTGNFEYSTFIPGRFHGTDFRMNFELTYLESKAKQEDLYKVLQSLKRKQLFKVSEYDRDFDLSLEFHDDQLKLCHI
ncbi:M protein [Sclerotinia sclerotiorum rhabdovirus 1]|nr:M protein [Sclerotinia sclerotiorum rhabdovirus 1]